MGKGNTLDVDLSQGERNHQPLH